MFVGDVVYAISYIAPEILIALIFYAWYSKKRLPKADPAGVIDIRPKIRRHKIKAIIFSAIIFVGLLAIAENGAKSSGVTWTVGKCVSSNGAKLTGYTSCSGNHFAKVIAIVKSKVDCPASSTNTVTETSNDSSPGSIVCLDSNQ